MPRATLASISSPYEEPIRSACEDAHPRMRQSAASSLAVLIAPSLDGINPRIWIGDLSARPSIDYLAVYGAAFKGWNTLEQNIAALLERLRSAPLYATSFTDSQGYAVPEARNQLAWMADY